MVWADKELEVRRPSLDGVVKQEEHKLDRMPNKSPTMMQKTDTDLIVDFDGPDDPVNPVNWKTSYKWTAIILMSAITLVVYV